MSLVENAMEKSYIIDKVTELDEYGSVITTYKDGAEIAVAYSFDTSTQARIAQQEGITNRYTLTTKKNIVLNFPDIIRRVSDNRYFKVTSKGTDNATPNSSGMSLRQVEAEEWSLPANEQTAST